MIRELLHLGYYKIKTLLYLDFDFTPSSIIKNIGSFLVYSLFLIAFYFIAQTVIELVLVKYRLGLFLLHRFIGIGLFMFGLAVTAGNLIVSYSTLYRSPEINFLLSKPIRYESLFIIKFLDNFFYSSSTLFIFLLAGLAGYGTYFHLSISFYLWSFFIAILPFVFTHALIGVLTLFLFIKISTKIGVKSTIFLIAIFYGFSVIYFFNVSSPVNLVMDILPYYPNIDIDFSFLQSPLISYLPNFLVSDAFFAFVRGNSLKLVINSLIIFLLMSGVFIFTVVIAGRYYYKSYLDVLDLKFSNKKKSFFNRPTLFDRITLINPKFDSLIIKEIVLFIREPSQMVHLAVMTLLIILFISGIGSTQVIILKAVSPQIQSIIYLSILVFVLFMIIALSLRFVFPMLSLEGETYWRLRSAPINISTIVNIKLFIIIILTGLIGFFLMKFSHRYLPQVLYTQSLFLLLFHIFTIVPLVFSMGSVYVNFKEKNPIRISSSQGATVTFLLCLIYLTFIIALMYIPISDFFDDRFYGRTPIFEEKVYQYNIVLGVITLISICSSYIISIKQFRKDI
jgi:ABC-2 type transport system permease protein